MAITKIARKDSQLQAPPKARQPNAPNSIVMKNSGFLKPFRSANVPQIGPIIATSKVAIEPA